MLLYKKNMYTIPCHIFNYFVHVMVLLIFFSNYFRLDTHQGQIPYHANTLCWNLIQMKILRRILIVRWFNYCSFVTAIHFFPTHLQVLHVLLFMCCVVICCVVYVIFCIFIFNVCKIGNYISDISMNFYLNVEWRSCKLNE